ncbi:MAG TPA: PqqD family protein [Acidimicrobiales bacterium]|nr:PqqD family protein [Acidimicrobiales bacterium]
MFPSLSRRDVLWDRWVNAQNRLAPVWEAAPPLACTFALPRDRAAFIAAATADPSARWCQRPADTAAPDVRITIDDPRRADRRPDWIVEPVRDGSGDLDVVIRICSLVPLTIDLAAPDPTHPWCRLDAPTRRALRRAVVAVLVACRDDLISEDEAPGVPCTIVQARLDAATAIVVSLQPTACDSVADDFDRGSHERLYPSADTAELWRGLATPGPVDAPEGVAPGFVAVDSVTSRLVDGTVVVHDAATGHVAALNASASYLWVALADGLLPGQAIDEVAEGLGVDPVAVAQDIWAQIARWTGDGLLVRADAPTPEPRVAPVHGRATVTSRPVRFFGTPAATVSVQGPDDVFEWLDPALSGWQRGDTADPVAQIDLAPSPHGWTMTTSDGRRDDCRAPQQLGPLARDACLRLISAASAPMLTATVLAIGSDAVVILGPAEHRRALVRHCFDAGLDVITLDVTEVFVSSDGTAMVRSDGLAIKQQGPWWLWYEDARVRPGHPDQLGWTVDGTTLRYWRPRGALTHGPRPARALVVDRGLVERADVEDGPHGDEGGDGVGDGHLHPAEALSEIIAHRSDALEPFDATQLDTLLAWLGRIDASALNWTGAQGFAAGLVARLGDRPRG